MPAGAERHARIDGQGLPARERIRRFPRGTNEKPPPDRQGLEILLPVIRPILFPDGIL